MFEIYQDQTHQKGGIHHCKSPSFTGAPATGEFAGEIIYPVKYKDVLLYKFMRNNSAINDTKIVIGRISIRMTKMLTENGETSRRMNSGDGKKTDKEITGIPDIHLIINTSAETG